MSARAMVMALICIACAPLRSEAGSALTPMLKRVMPAVVSIAVQGKEIDNTDATLADPFYRKFFGLPDDAPGNGFQSAGSGVIIDAARGYIVTNQHVVESAEKIGITLWDGRHLDADVVGSDPETDIAVVRITADRLVQAEFGSASSLQIGDTVVAIGNPFGLGETATMGIVSALGRRASGSEGYEGYIQTDASTNPGNSGGPLVDEYGRVVGLNSAIIGPAGGSIGIGFAVPAETVATVMRQLIESGKIVRGEVGLVTQDLTEDLAEAFGVTSGPGALISEVISHSPAAAAGLQPGDVIRAVDGRSVRDGFDVRRLVGSMQMGSRPAFKIDRAGRTLEFFPTVSAAEPQSEPDVSLSIDRGPLAGVEVQGAEGSIKVISVPEGSVAAAAGLQPDDLIVALNQVEMAGLRQLTTFLQSERSRVLVTIKRSGHRRFVAADLRTQ